MGDEVQVGRWTGGSGEGNDVIADGSGGIREARGKFYGHLVERSESEH